MLRYLDLCPVGDIVEGNKDNPFYAFKLLFRMGNVLTEVNTKCTEGKGETKVRFIDIHKPLNTRNAGSLCNSCLLGLIFET